MEDRDINSDAYWSYRFATDWEALNGPEQSRFFARLTIKHLPSWFLWQIRREGLTLADWGCAQGDGTDVWASYIDTLRLSGVDFSPVAVEQASKRYPAIKFICEDWLGEETNLDVRFDVIYSSNTLEHFQQPYDVLNSISKKAKKAIVLALPYCELDRIPEHFFSFLPENVPLVLPNGFRLLWARVIDCASLQDTLWAGHQIILLYADIAWIDSFRLTLNDCLIEQLDTSSRIANLSFAVTEREGQISSLNQAVAEREGQISSLNQAVAEREGQISSLNQVLEGLTDQITCLNQSLEERDQNLLLAQQYKDDKEIYIAQLNMELEMMDKGLFGYAWKATQRARRVPYYLKRSAQLVRSGGISAFMKGVKGKLDSVRLGNKLNYIQPHASQGYSKHLKSHLTRNTQSFHLSGPPPVLRDELVVITGVPYDDVGGGQRGSQLTRCALKSGRKVVFIYVYKKYDFRLNTHVESDINIFGLYHEHIDSISPSDLLELISVNATVLIEFPHPKVIPYLDIANRRGVKTIFELIDDWETSLGAEWFDSGIYRRFIAESGFVVGTARVLVEKLVALGRKDAIYLPNAANEYIFDKYQKYEKPRDFPVGLRRVGLYFGSLYGDWFDWDCIHTAAKENGDIGFLLIGDSPGRMGMPKNVHFLGEKPIEELPFYLAHADFAMLPFIPGKISDAVSPIKVFEYLFSGKPVIATLLPEIIGYPGVYLAENNEQFSKLCGDDKIGCSLGFENDIFISNNSWFGRLDKIVGLGSGERLRGSVSAIILMHNNKDIIGRCLQTLHEHGKDHLREIIVVDNASSDGGADFVEEMFPIVQLLRNQENGCSSGRNLGVKVAQGQYLAFFDSDQWFTSSSFLVEALAILERDANVGAIGWGAGWFDASRSDLGGMIADYCQNRAMNDEAITVGYRSDIGYLGTAGFIIPTSVFNATDGFDTNYDPTCFEDTDLSFQVKRLGLDVCFRDLAGIRHQPHQTTAADSGSKAYSELFYRNAKYFKKKWECYPQFFLDYKG